MDSGDPSESQVVTVSGLGYADTMFIVKPVFTIPKIKIYGLMTPVCNSDPTLSLGIIWCVGGGQTWQLPCDRMPGQGAAPGGSLLWVTGDKNTTCGWTKEWDDNGSFYPGACTPLESGTLHFKAVMYYGNRTLDGTASLSTDWSDACRWCIYLEVSAIKDHLGADLYCIPVFWGYYVGQSSIIYPYGDGVNEQYVLRYQTPDTLASAGVPGALNGSYLMVGLEDFT